MEQSTVRRLAFIKYLYQTAISQSYAPAPLSCASILTMHDSVELFLQLASEQLNVGGQQLGFMDYWGVLSKKLVRRLEQQESMRRLNKSRVALKHHGTFPSQLDIESFRASVTSFFDDNTPLVFGVQLADVSLVEYVNPRSARDCLKEAERHGATGDTVAALDKIALAFAAMTDDYEMRKQGRYERSPFYFGRDLASLSSFFMGLSSGSLSSPERQLGDFVDRVKEAVEAMQEAIKILAFGLDYRKYSKFRWLTPGVTRTLSGTYNITRVWTHAHNPTVEDVRFCIDFVIESSLALAEFDYSVTGHGKSA